MNKSSHQPFLKQGLPRESALVGAPPGFDFLAALRQARFVRAAIAFGHMTGWKKVEAALRNPAAQRIQILLGQSFLQTEPDLLDILLAMQGCQSNFHVQLAPMTPTFHPKVWLIEILPKLRQSSVRRIFLLVALPQTPNAPGISTTRVRQIH